MHINRVRLRIRVRELGTSPGSITDGSMGKIRMDLLLTTSRIAANMNMSHHLANLVLGLIIHICRLKWRARDIA